MAKSSTKKKPAKKAYRKPIKKIVELKSVTLAPGRPSSYREEFAAQARKLCDLGATDRDLADFFEVSTYSIWNWQARYPEFCAALNRAKEAADDRVERSLYARATGYTYDSEKIMVVDGEVHRVKTLEYVPPDVTACIFWLKNRRSAEWRDKADHYHTHAQKLSLQGGNMSIEEAQQLFRTVRSLSPEELERSFKLVEGKIIEKA